MFLPSAVCGLYFLCCSLYVFVICLFLMAIPNIEFCIILILKITKFWLSKGMRTSFLQKNFTVLKWKMLNYWSKLTQNNTENFSIINLYFQVASYLYEIFVFYNIAFNLLAVFLIKTKHTCTYVLFWVRSIKKYIV